ncbi:MAG: aspartate aminotransferase family protein [Rhodospirillales bacterium]
MTATAPSHLFYQSSQRRPLIERAEGIYIWAQDGRRFIDGSSGAMVANIGHGNPRVLDAMRRQMERATFAYRLHFENEPAEALAASLAAALPDPLNRVFFVSGGSEAVESCIKLARQYALAIGEGSRWKVVSRFPSYHGCTLGALALTGYSPLTEPFAPMFQAMPQIPAPLVHLDRDNLSEAERGLRYADLLEAEIERQGPESVLAFVMEPIGGAATGALVAPDSYYARIREICDRHGILLIYDEVMSGLGRSGRFMGGDHWPARPDLIALSKGFAAGYAPLGAMVAADWIVEPVLAKGGFLHGFTYAGNPLACAAGQAVLAEIERQDLVAKAAARGTTLKAGLEALMARFPFIGDVRGRGLLLAFELVADRATMAPLPADWNAHSQLVELAYERGLILYSRRSRGGHLGDHILVCPPMIVTEAQVAEILGVLAETLEAFAAGFGLGWG